ncbi:rhodopsin, GQ-coupled [Onthophagus taurus]|uniref:rhodopsin, GQ-coupled n=1 Tax=Onthophagus taurus TaxID=166361 RepID=UPI000C209AE2|nr:prostacyclin receptor [Onthophagus taurus]
MKDDSTVVVLLAVVGIVGHITALWILQKSTKQRNPKHVFLLRCLAANDMVAQIGMLSLIILLPHFKNRWMCAGFVLVRAFGLGSGCVAFVMAVERYLALTKPFFYQQCVTFRVLQIAIASIWSFGLFLTYLPLAGFGVYYSPNNETNSSRPVCRRYKDAKEFKDVTYSYVYFVVGVTLCTCIAYCNTKVFMALSRMGNQRKVLIRRISRSTMNNRVERCRQNATTEELAFAKVMAVLCITFIICWLPQMIMIPIMHLDKDNKLTVGLNKIADSLIMFYFAFDPYIYVVQKYFDKRRQAYRAKRSNSNTAHSSTSVGAGTPTAVLIQHPEKEVL